MSRECPENVREASGAQTNLTTFGQCLDIVRTPRARGRVGAPPVPTRPDPSRPEGSGLSVSQNGFSTWESPDPETATIQREVWHHLTEALGWLSLNDHGRNWPLPRRDRLRTLLAGFDADLCIRAARETREIVKAQDRAPNITSLFEKKLRDLAEVRSTVRGELDAR
jgi:hypothetical protein